MAAGRRGSDYHMPVLGTVERPQQQPPAGPAVNMPVTSTVHSSCYCYSCAEMLMYSAERKSLSVVMTVVEVVDRMMNFPALVGHSVQQLLGEQAEIPTTVMKHYSGESV